MTRVGAASIWALSLAAFLGQTACDSSSVEPDRVPSAEAATSPTRSAPAGVDSGTPDRPLRDSSGPDSPIADTATLDNESSTPDVDAGEAGEAGEAGDASEAGEAGDASEAGEAGDASEAGDVWNDSDAADGGPPEDSGEGGAPDGGSLTTDEVLAAAGSTCLACAQANDCLDPTVGGNNCEQFSGADHDNCISILQCVLTGCGASGDVTTCLCGTIGSQACSSGSTPPNGTCDSDYFTGFGTEDVPEFWESMYDPSTSPGNADTVDVCLAFGGCTDCF
jgi:hypothetical protein